MQFRKSYALMARGIGDARWNWKLRLTMFSDTWALLYMLLCSDSIVFQFTGSEYVTT